MTAAPDPWAQGSLAQRLFAPRSILLVGASGDPSRATARPLRYLLRDRYPGRVVPVNPTRDEVLGHAAFRSVAEAGVAADHAFVMTGADALEGVLRDCAAVGVGVVTVYADGYAERGAEGATAQRRLAALARELGIRLLGPNCIGLVNATDRIALTVNASLEAGLPPAGTIGLVSQSGSMLGTLVSRGAARGIGFSRLVSVGNEADLTVGEIADLLVDDPHTRTILLFLETLRDAPRLARAARRAHAAGKAVVAYALGRSQAGASLAVSHTGALAGWDAAIDAFLRAHGIVRIEQLETLLEIAPLLAGGPPPGRDGPLRVAVVSTTGGGAAMVVDRMGLGGVVPAAPETALRARWAAQGITVGDSPVIDLTMAVTPARYATVLQGLMDSPCCDAVLAVVGSSAQTAPQLAVRPIVEVAHRAADPPTRGRKPLAVFLAPQADASLALLAAEGIAAFRTPEACADALAALARWTPPAADPGTPPPSPAVALAAARAPTDAARARGGRVRVVLDEGASLALFDELGVPTVPRRRVPADADPATLATAASGFAWPLAVKLLSAELPHKSDVGAVTLGVTDPVHAAYAIGAMRARVARERPDAVIDGALLQPMLAGVAEAIVGYRDDPLVGPVVLVGTGGRLAEVLRDAALRPAPVDAAGARAMLGEVRGLSALIAGARGQPRGDLRAVIDVIVALSRLALLPGLPVLEAEINPLLVGDAGAVALDGLVVLRADAPPDEARDA
jgi:acyl-CoA synthetase (NDP forming)